MPTINYMPKTLVKQTTESVDVDGVKVPLPGYYYLTIGDTAFCPPDLTVTKTNIPKLVKVSFTAFTATECLEDLDYTPEQKEALRQFYSNKLEQLLKPGDN